MTARRTPPGRAGWIVGIALVVVGVALTLAGLGGQLLWDDDEGHHDGRQPTFALASVQGADELVVEQDGTVLAVSVERAGQRITSYDELHGAGAHVFVVGTGLDSYQHVDLDDADADGTVEVTVADGGSGGDGYRVVFQASPDSGPDLLELGVNVEVAGAASSTEEIATDDVWTDGGLTVERQGLDFVLSEPWTGEDHHGGPAFLTLFRADDLAFVHGHAQTPDDDRFRFNLDLPGRGEYLAALEFVQDGELVTALFRFEL